MVIEELLVKLGFFSDLKGVKAFSSELAGVKKSIFGFIGKIEAAGTAVSAFFAHSLEGIDEQAKFARQVGVSVEQLQQLQYAAGIAGSSSEDMNASIRGLNKSIFEASEGAGSAVEVFGRLGISTMQGGRLKPTLQVLGELADKLRSLPQPQQEDFAQRVGISQSTVLLLQKGSAGIAELSNEARQLGIYSKKDAENAEEYVDSWRSLVQIFKILKNQIAIGLAPLFTSIVKSFTAWLKVNRELMTQGLTAFLTIVIDVLEIFVKALGYIFVGVGKVVEALGGLNSVLLLLASSAGVYALFKLPKIIKSVGLAFRAASVWAAAFDAAAFLPVVAAIAIFIALALVIQDVIVWLLHGKSVIGDWFGPVEQLGQKFADMWQWVKDEFMSQFQAIKDFFTGIADDFKRELGIIEDFFMRIGNRTKKFFHIKTDGAMPETVLSADVPLTNGAQISNIVNNSSSMSSVDNNPASNPVFNINVNASNSDAITDAVKQGIYQASRQAQRNNSSPVMI